MHPLVRRVLFILCLAAVLSAPALAQPGATRSTPRSAAELIPEAPIREDIFALAGDVMRGREAGTVDELRAAAWIAQRAQEAGLEPAGEDGTYFQFFPLYRLEQSADSRILVDGRPLSLWEDILPREKLDYRRKLPLVHVSSIDALEAGQVDVEGAVAVLPIRRPAGLPVDETVTPVSYLGAAVAEFVSALRSRRPAAIILVADSVSERAMPSFRSFVQQPQYVLAPQTATSDLDTRAPYFLVGRAAAERVGLIDAGEITFDLKAISSTAASVNVVARAPGTDPEVRDEYIVYSAHLDHDGIGDPVDGDSIWNGADDNASGTAALLAAGRAFVQQPARRSALFVWVGAEEKGLLGSEWFVGNPTVPREAMLANLNADIVGRNDPGTMYLLGLTPPYRGSVALAEAALKANEETARFEIDRSLDDPAHPEQAFTRSDQYNFAKSGIPALFFTSGLHADYHQPGDQPERIDVSKVAKVARWLYATGQIVANADGRPEVDPGYLAAP